MLSCAFLMSCKRTVYHFGGGGRRLSLALCTGWMFAMLLAGCGGNGPKPDMPADTVYTRAREFYDKGKWIKAHLEFEAFVFNYPGAARIDSAQFLLAMCQYNQKNFIVAADEFLRLHRRYSTSPLVPDADILRAHSLLKISPDNPALDQERTLAAILELKLFKDLHPLSEHVRTADSLLGVAFTRLSTRDFQVGRLYSRMGRHHAARIYFQEVIDQFPDSPLVPEAFYYIADGYRHLDSLDRAIEYYEKLVYLYTDHKLTPKAKTHVKELHNRREWLREMEETP